VWARGTGFVAGSLPAGVGGRIASGVGRQLELAEIIGGAICHERDDSPGIRGHESRAIPQPPCDVLLERGSAIAKFDTAATRAIPPVYLGRHSCFHCEPLSRSLS
jgi:hypothetical protein